MSDKTVHDIPDEELLRRAVQQVRPIYGTRRKVPRWIAVMDNFMLGCTYATQLCVRFGINPDEIVKKT